MTEKNYYKRVVLPILTRADAETMHERTISALAAAQSSAAGRSILRRIAGDIPAAPMEIMGLQFPNVLGVAAGFDKDVRTAQGLALLGFGHIEVGTITPQPQQGNPRPRVFRLPEDAALINRMGFPSAGAREVSTRLERLTAEERSFIIGVSLGKQKETTLEDAANDYVAVMRATYAQADYLAVNISSPNTPELRKLQGRKYLEALLKELVIENQRLAAQFQREPRPLVVKIAPDLSPAEVGGLLEVILDQEVSGIIATNTTTSRSGLTSTRRAETGGLSGSPLAEKSLEIIRFIARETNGRLPIIGVGGIRSAADVKMRLDAGASLVQLYTALVYEGPGIAGHILRGLSEQHGAIKYNGTHG